MNEWNYAFQLEYVARVLGALILGGIVGMEREYHEKPAGFRTHMLICMGAAIFTIISLMVGERFNQDPGRISAQIVSGMGFLGAGAILRDGVKVTGLTTAAGIWLVAAIGMAVGYGHYVLALSSVLLFLIAQVLLVWFERLLDRIRHRAIIRVRCPLEWHYSDDIRDMFESSGVRVVSVKPGKSASSLLLEFTVTGSASALQQATRLIIDIKGVEEVV